ncbi:MAG: potassium-transporting ATPase subunit KdpC [Deltaproteobacteria bacterium]|jgi:potassium-transporting ATPase KdpC subunit|nr:potassium-transporting ATPase subunit KdpC [Deltaproteobacteria bacterium]
MRGLLIAIRMTVVLTVLLGLIYPLAFTGIARVFFPWQSAGSLVSHRGRVIGSAIIGQNFSAPQYFHSRPSAAGDKGYDASGSGGSNLGPTNKVLIETVRKRLKDELETDPGVAANQVPVDLVTTSGSGLDPEISPAAAELQIPRVAKARGLSQDTVAQLVRQNTRGRWLGLLGEPGVNVLTLNLALDDAATLNGRRASP